MSFIAARSNSDQRQNLPPQSRCAIDEDRYTPDLLSQHVYAQSRKHSELDCQLLAKRFRDLTSVHEPGPLRMADAGDH
jgi:hypothetical protein